MPAVVMCSWDDVPHIGEEEKARLQASVPAYQLKARRSGYPVLGSGVIWPFDEDDISIDPFEIPPHYARGYGFDVGWNYTAAVWGAWNRDTDVIYLTEEYKVGQKEPSVHASAIKRRGDWMTGAIDPASAGAGKQKDGEALLQVYEDEGLILEQANNAVEAGILEVYQRLSTGRLKIFSNLRRWFEEFNLYHRDDKGRVVKQNDHLMDASRYLVMTPEAWTVEAMSMRNIEYRGTLNGR